MTVSSKRVGPAAYEFACGEAEENRLSGRQEKPLFMRESNFRLMFLRRAALTAAYCLTTNAYSFISTFREFSKRGNERSDMSRVFYEVNDDEKIVAVLAIGVKVRNQLFIGGQEYEL